MSFAPRKSRSERVGVAAAVGLAVGMLGADCTVARRPPSNAVSRPRYAYVAYRYRVNPGTANRLLISQEVPQRLCAGLDVASHLRPLAVDAHLHRHLAGAGCRRANEALALQLLLHRAVRQEGEAVAFERHRLQ